jgi:hypothetical protein
MNVRTHTLRTIFTVSVLLTAFWVTGFAWEAVAGRDAPLSALVIAGALVTIAVSFAALRGGRLVIPNQIEAGEVFRVFVPRLVGAYIVSVPIVGVVTWLLIRTFSDNPKDSEAGIVVGLMAVWLPLWFAPAVGAEWSWRTMRKRGVA